LRQAIKIEPTPVLPFYFFAGTVFLLLTKKQSMEYKDFVTAVRKFNKDDTQDYLEQPGTIEPEQRELFLKALNYGFNCREIADMLANGTLTDNTLADIVRQKTNDNTTEIRA
jgi:hypothetical protein